MEKDNNKRCLCSSAQIPALKVLVCSEGESKKKKKFAKLSECPVPNAKDFNFTNK